MQRILSNDNFKPVMIALILLGIVVLIIGLSQFLGANNQLQNNLAYQLQNGGSVTNIQSQDQAQSLIASSIDMRRLTAQRNQAVILIGAGIALTALGWLGYDLARTRLRSPSSA